MITIEVKFLGPAKDMAGEDSTTLTLADNAGLDELRAELTARFPKISAALPTVRFAVNQEFVVGDLTLKDGDEVAVIPPVSGGEKTDRTWVGSWRARVTANPVGRQSGEVGRSSIF